jgi:Ribosomally synthesized peptide prototyped by Frankia Franean1_4349.
MSRQAVEQVVGRLVLDPEFRRQLTQQPDAALAQYDLTQEEREQIGKADAQEVNQAAGELEQRLSKGIRGNF